MKKCGQMKYFKDYIKMVCGWKKTLGMTLSRVISREIMGNTLKMTSQITIEYPQFSGSHSCDQSNYHMFHIW